jgi:hypothetical protein
MSTTASNNLLSIVGQDLLKAVEATDHVRCQELLEAASGQTMTIALLKESNIGVTLGKAVKGFKRHQRTERDETACWKQLVERGTQLIQTWKAAAAMEEKSTAKQEPMKSNHRVGLPSTVSEYKTRLTTHSKELYKDPPVLPPGKIVIDSKNYGLPTRDKKSGLLIFAGAKEFTPNRSPEQVLRSGSFGGTYFRPIHSGVTNVSYNAKDVLDSTVDPTWIEGLNMSLLTSSTYRAHVNKYGVKCGGSLGMWESSGWIADSDPYGWFQWYCRFYQGRRCSDDSRQISRWLKSAGIKGRFRSQLCNKILAANTKCDDASISPVIRQTLLHWGLEIDDYVLSAHRKR